MPLLRDEIRDHSAEEMLFIRRAAIAFLLVVVCFGVLMVNLYHLQVEQHNLPDPVKPERHQNAAHCPQPRADISIATAFRWCRISPCIACR